MAQFFSRKIKAIFQKITICTKKPVTILMKSALEEKWTFKTCWYGCTSTVNALTILNIVNIVIIPKANVFCPNVKACTIEVRKRVFLLHFCDIFLS